MLIGDPVPSRSTRGKDLRRPLPALHLTAGQDPPPPRILSGVAHHVVIRQIRLLESLTVAIPSPASVRRAVEVRNAYHISFWDAAIVSAAEAVECDVVLSEDLNADQYYAGIQVVNPFSEGFDCRALCP